MSEQAAEPVAGRNRISTTAVGLGAVGLAAGLGGVGLLDMGTRIGIEGGILLLVAALGLFQALADAWPDDIEKRRQILKLTVVTADAFSQSDHHKIRIFDVDSGKLIRRTMQVGDQGSLWEYLDWTLSVSSNAAAAMIMPG